MAKWGQIPPLENAQAAPDQVNQPPHYNSSSIIMRRLIYLVRSRLRVFHTSTHPLRVA